MQSLSKSLRLTVALHRRSASPPGGRLINGLIGAASAAALNVLALENRVGSKCNLRHRGWFLSVKGAQKGEEPLES